MNRIIRRSALSLSLCSIAVATAACGPKFPQITVGGRLLEVMETVYGTSKMNERYCESLTSKGQFEIMLMNKGVCADMNAKKQNRDIFHTGGATYQRAHPDETDGSPTK